MCKFCDTEAGWVKLIESTFKLPDGKDLTVRLRHDVPNSELDMQAVIYGVGDAAPDWSEWSDSHKLLVCPICNRVLVEEDSPARILIFGTTSVESASGVLIGVELSVEDAIANRQDYGNRGYPYTRLVRVTSSKGYYIGNLCNFADVQ